MRRTTLIKQVAQWVSGLPAEERVRLESRLCGNWAAQTYVAIEQPRSCEGIEGVVISGEALPEGGWDLEADFVVLAPDGERYRVVGHACEITVLSDDDRDEFCDEEELAA